jgi:hypothetical protein
LSFSFQQAKMKLILALALAAAAEGATLSAPSMGMHSPKEDAQVTHFLASIDLAEYAAAFAEHKVDYETLTELNDVDLKEMGIKALGARKRILKAATSDEPCPGCNFMLPYLMYDLGTSQLQYCSFVDFNGDGLQDYACADYSGGGNFGSYLNTGKDFCILVENDLQRKSSATYRRQDMKMCNESATVM